MLRELALFLAVLCLVQAAFLDIKKVESREEGEHGDLSPQKIQASMDDAHKDIYKMKDYMDQVVGNILQLGKGKKEWFDAITKVVDFMHGGVGMYTTAFEHNVGAFFQMFSGGHIFQQVSRCGNLKRITKRRQSLNDIHMDDDDLPEVQQAIAKDIICFDNVLTEAYGLNYIFDITSCPPTEQDVMWGILEFFRHLFQIRNDGIDFYWAVHNVTQFYQGHSTLGDLHTHFNNEIWGSDDSDLVERLLRALKSSRNRK